MTLEVSELDNQLFICEYDCALDIFIWVPLEIGN
jgi:hypothetical protein